VDVRIGVTQSPKELILEMSDDTDRDKLVKSIESALGADGVLWLTDRKGRKVGVPVAKVAYVEVGTNDDSRHVGFGTH
jgi:hypothetical protein